MSAAVPDLRMLPVTAADLRALEVQAGHPGDCRCAVCSGTEPVPYDRRAPRPRRRK